MAVVVIADSRGRDLQQLMREEAPEKEIYVETMRGASSHKSHTDHSETQAETSNPNDGNLRPNEEG